MARDITTTITRSHQTTDTGQNIASCAGSSREKQGLSERRELGREATAECTESFDSSLCFLIFFLLHRALALVPAFAPALAPASVVAVTARGRGIRRNGASTCGAGWVWRGICRRRATTKSRRRRRNALTSTRRICARERSGPFPRANCPESTSQNSTTWPQRRREEKSSSDGVSSHTRTCTSRVLLLTAQA